MENIIITATNVAKSFLYDLELPVTVPVEKLKCDIVEALNSYDPALFLQPETTALFCNRLGRRLQERETLESAGLWNGDYITLTEV